MTGVGRVTLDWLPSPGPLASSTVYRVRYRPGWQPGWQALHVPISMVTVTLPGLKPGVLYDVMVEGETYDGFVVQSDVITVRVQKDSCESNQWTFISFFTITSIN